MIQGCIGGCVEQPNLPMCRVCTIALAAPFGSSLRQYLEAKTRYQRSSASSHGKRGTVRQKFQNKTWKFMRVRPVKLGYYWKLLRLKQIHGEARWEEAEVISMLRKQNATMSAKGQRLVWHAEKAPARFVKHVWRNKRRRR